MQIISLIFGGTLIENKEIGLIKIKFEKEFHNFKPSLAEVYLLHNYAVLNNDFEIVAISQEIEIPQAIKHKTKPIYGVLFHPEVRNKRTYKLFLRKSIMHFHIILTEKCNLRCKYCYEKSMNEFNNGLDKKWSYDFDAPWDSSGNRKNKKVFRKR